MACNPTHLIYYSTVPEGAPESFIKKEDLQFLKTTLFQNPKHILREGEEIYLACKESDNLWLITHINDPNLQSSAELLKSKPTDYNRLKTRAQDLHSTELFFAVKSRLT